MKFTPLCLFVLVGAMALFAADEKLSPSEIQADLREATVLSIEQTIQDMTHTSRDWEQARYRTYQQQDLDGDGTDDTVLLTTFEHGNYWRRELFVCLSSAPKQVMHTNLGGKGENEAEKVNITNRTIIVTGKRYTPDDAMCCPSLPYKSTYVVADGKIKQMK